MKNIFSLVAGSYRTLFGYTPAGTYTPIVPGARGTALKSVADQFVSIGTIMSEGNVSPELGETALQALFQAQLAVNHAITIGWNNGDPSKY